MAYDQITAGWLTPYIDWAKWPQWIKEWNK